MICQPCRDRHHENCPGGTWCDCQHRPGSAALDKPLPDWERELLYEKWEREHPGETAIPREDQPHA